MVLNLLIEEISEKYLNGVGTTKLAGEYGCCIDTIIRRLRNNGIKIRTNSEAQKGLQSGKNNPRYLDLPMSTICEKYLNGINSTELAKEYECSDVTIRQKLCDSGVKIRSSGESRIGLHAGENSPHWKGGISSGKYCSLFNNKFKEIIRNSYNRRCFLCGKSEEGNNNRKHDVHHVNYNKVCLCRIYCEFVPLCRSCHMKTNGKRNYWEDLIMNYLYPERYFMVGI